MDPAHLYQLVGARIAAARGKRVSQTRLAQMVGLSRGSVANIERGRQRPPLHTLWDIATMLNVDPRSLIPNASDLGAAKESFADPQDAPKRVVQVAGASLSKVQQFIERKKAEVGYAHEAATVKGDHRTPRRGSPKAVRRR